MNGGGSRTDEHPILGWERRARVTEFVAGVVRPVLRQGPLETDEVVERAVSRLGAGALDPAQVLTTLEALAMTDDVQALPHDDRRLWRLSGQGRAWADREVDRARELLQSQRREFVERARRGRQLREDAGGCGNRRPRTAGSCSRSQASRPPSPP